MNFLTLGEKHRDEQQGHLELHGRWRCSEVQKRKTNVKAKLKINEVNDDVQDAQGEGFVTQSCVPPKSFL